jgi:hypothetical protein
MTVGCSPFARPRFIERSEDNDKGGLLGAALRNAEASGVYTKERVGFDPETRKKLIRHVGAMVNFDFDQLVNYYKAQGWLSLDKKATAAAMEEGIDAPPIYKPTRDVDQVGMAAAVTKTYLEAAAGGVRQLADNFLRKVEAGDKAVVEGMQLASQMQGMSRFGGYALGWDQGYGRAMRTQALREPGWKMQADKALDQVTDKLGNLSQYEDKFQEIAQKMGDPSTQVDGINALIGLARQIQFLDNPMDIANAATTMSIVGDRWQTLFINGLLSNPATISTNVLGSAWAVMRPMLQLGAAKAYASTGLAGARVAEEVAAEAGASLAAMFTGFADAARLGWRAASTDTSLYGAGLKDAQGIRNDAKALQDLYTNFGLGEASDDAHRAWKELWQFVKLPSRAMLGIDEATKHLVIRGEVAANAVKRAYTDGIDLNDAAALGQYIDNEMKAAFHLHGPDAWTKYKLKSVYSMENPILQEADRATFQEANKLASSVTGMLQKAPLLRPFVPFVRTPLNILKQGFVESTGFGALMNAAKIAGDSGFNPTVMKTQVVQKLLEDPGETFRVSGQIALMSAIAGTFYMGAMNGMIVGGGPGRWARGGKDAPAQKAWEAMINEQGKVPYAIHLGDGSYVPFSRLPEPMAGMMRMFADMGMYSSYVSQESQEEWIAAMAGIMVSGLYQSTFLKGVNDIMDLMAMPDQTLGVKGGKAIQNWMATQTPFGGLLSYVDQINDPFKHAYQGATLEQVWRVHEDTFGTGIFAKLADRLPGFNGSPALIDQITGKPVPTFPGGGPAGLNPAQLAIPVLPRGGEGQNGAWAAIFKIKGSYNELSPNRSGAGYKLTVPEQQELNRRMATIVINGKTLEQAVLEYYSKPDVQQYVSNKGAAFMDVRSKIERGLDRVIHDYYDAALMKYGAEIPSIGRRQILAEGAKRAAMANDMTGAQGMRSEIDSLFDEARLRGVF